jgi:tetratricopeptide (TPR) repeat protein
MAVAGLTVLTLGAARAASADVEPPPARVEALIQRNKLDEAIAQGEGALGMNAADVDLRVALAHAYAARGRSVHRVIGVAIGKADVSRGSVTLPKPGPGTPSRVEVRYERSWLDKALGQIREAGRIAPRRKDVRFTLLYLLTDAGEIEQAAIEIKKVATEFAGEPGLADSLASYGVERARRGDLRGALTLEAVVVQAFPDNPAVQADYGLTLLRAGRREEALASVDKAAALAPADPRIQRSRATAALLLRDLKRAREAYLASYRASREEQDRLGAAVSAIGIEEPTAKTELEDLATPAASSDTSLTALAGDFLRALAAPPASKAPLDLAARLVDEGKDLLAIPLLDRALGTQPENTTALALLSRIYGNFDADALARPAKKAPPKPGKPSGKT